MADHEKMTKEELIKLVEALTASLEKMEKKDAELLLRELKAHQVELEAQNRQLREAQSELEDARDRLSDLYDSAPIGYLTLDENSRVLEMNQTCANMLGVERPHAIGKPFIQFVEKTSIRAYIEHLSRARYDKKERVTAELKLAVKDRPPLDVQILSTFYEDPLHRKKVLRSAILDITERKKAEEYAIKFVAEQAGRAESERSKKALAESEAIYRAIGEAIPFGIWIASPDGAITYLSDSFLNLVGMTMEEAKGFGWTKLLPPEYAEKAAAEWRRLLRENEFMQAEFPVICQDGYEYNILSRGVPIKDSEGKVICWAGINLNITDRTKAEARLAEEKERLLVTLKSINEGVIALDGKGNVYLTNKEAERLTGWAQEDSVGKPLKNIFNLFCGKTGEHFEDPAKRLARSRELTEFYDEIMLENRNGSRRAVVGSVNPIINEKDEITGEILVFKDVTEIARMQRELLKTQKLESIGILAGGIAHDFNNLLTGILGNIELAKDSVPPGDALERLTDAEEAIKKAKNVTKQLITYSSAGAPVRELAYMDSIVRESADYILSGSKIKEEISVQEDLWFVEVDEGQISQSLNNIFLNAVQAMPEGGNVRIICENVVVEPEEFFHAAPGKYVEITVEDTGTGIPRESLPKIFDPFFSTKEGASGLGLTTAYSVVRNHGGFITVESEPGAGTSVHVFLPASTVQKKPVSEEKRTEKISADGQGRVLVMDDEDMIRNIAGAILSRLGYEVKLAANGEEALTLYRDALEEGKPFDAVILDQTVRAGMGGLETLQKMKEFDPEVKAIISSGYSTDPIMSEFRKYGFAGVIRKPFSKGEFDDLMKKVVRRG